MSVEDWGKHLTAALSSIDGIVEVRAYDELPGQIVASPTLIWFPLSGTQSYGMGSPAVAFHRVRLSLFVSVGLLPEGVGIAVPFIEKVRNTLAGPGQLGGAVTQIMPPAEGDFFEGPLTGVYGGRTFAGINFFFVVREGGEGPVARG